jgi:hypothetical protein
MSKDLQKLFGEIVFDNEYKTFYFRQHDVKDYDDFNNGKTYKIYKDINDVLYVYIGSTRSSFKKGFSKLKKEPKVRRNWRYDDFYNMIHFIMLILNELKISHVIMLIV